jgi:hypothetical protein
MKKKFLSIIAAGLMLGGVSHIKAMDAVNTLIEYFSPAPTNYSITYDSYVSNQAIKDPELPEAVRIQRLDERSGFQISYTTVDRDVPYRFVRFTKRGLAEPVIDHEARLENQLRALERRFRKQDAMDQARAKCLGDKNNHQRT